MSAVPALPLPSTPLPESRLRLLTELTQGLDAGALLYVSGYAAGLAAAQRNGHTAVQSPSHAAERERATVLYASHTGNGRRIAEKLAASLESRGLAARAVAAGDYATRELAQERLLYLVASTHGDGDPPEDARAFFDFLLGRKAPRLASLRYAVLALGDSSYPKFCEAARIADERLAALGATAITARVDCDIDFEGAAATWSETALQASARDPETGWRCTAPLDRPAAARLGARRRRRNPRYADCRGSPRPAAHHGPRERSPRHAP